MFGNVCINTTSELNSFSLTGSNLDDYFVVKGGTFGSTGSINYYKEFNFQYIILLYIL